MQSSKEIAAVIRTRVLMVARDDSGYPDTFSAAERWAVQRIRALRAQGEEGAGLRVSWVTYGRKRHFGIEIRRADGTCEPAPTGPAETLQIGYQAPNVSAQTAAEERRKRKTEKLARLADKGAIKRAP